MKKLLKISALALAMSALLFSCADPNNTPAAPEAPKAETVKPSEIAKPDGYTPTAGAKAVNTKEAAEAAVQSIADSMSKLGPALGSALKANPIAAKMQTEMEKINKFNETSSDLNTPHNEELDVSIPAETVALGENGTYELKKFEGKGHSKLTKSETSISVDNVFKQINDTKISMKGNDFDSIKSYEKSDVIYQDFETKGTFTPEDLKNENMDAINAKTVSTTSSSIAYLFDNGTYNGILVINKTSSEDYMKYQKAIAKEKKDQNSKYKDLFEKKESELKPEEKEALTEFYDTKCGSEYLYTAVFYDINGENPWEYAKATKPSEEGKLPAGIKNL